MNTIYNAFTIDVEDYFQVSAFENYISRDNWNSTSLRVEKNIDRILQMLDDNNKTKATFFTLGWIAEKCPKMLVKIASEGHEIASHGYSHVRITGQNQQDFSADIIKTKKILEDISGQEVKGYRAASFSIVEETLWAHDLILEAGYKYSSSIYPIKHDLYGIPDSSREPYKTANNLIEIPVSTWRLGDTNLPCGGGGYFRLLPYLVSKTMMKKVCDEEKMSLVFYFHPWEIDHAQPSVENTSFKTRFRHYTNLKRMQPKLERLLKDFHWGRMDTVFNIQ